MKLISIRHRLMTLQSLLEELRNVNTPDKSMDLVGKRSESRSDSTRFTPIVTRE